MLRYCVTRERKPGAVRVQWEGLQKLMEALLNGNARCHAHGNTGPDSHAGAQADRAEF